MLVFSMYDSCGPNTTMFPSSAIALTEANGLLTSASQNFLLHFLPSQTNSNFASPSTCIGLPIAAASLTVFRRLRPRNTFLSDRSYGLGSSRTDSDLHDLSHPVNCVHRAWTSSPRSVKFSTSNLTLRFALIFSSVSHVVYMSFASVSERKVSSRTSRFFLNPSRCPSRV